MAAQAPSSYVAGVATVDITPVIGTPLGGFAARRFHSSTGIYHPLRAVVTCIGDGTTDVLLVTVEWLGCYDDLADEVSGMIAERTGLDRSQILINASHTHCGPNHCGPHFQSGGRRWVGPVDLRQRQDAIERIVQAAVTVRHHRYPVRLHRSVGRCSLAMNRRRPDPADPSRVDRVMRPNPDAPVDHDVPVITISSAEDGTIHGVIFGYGCHPTARGGLQIGGDYVGFALDAVGEAFPNAQPMFLQGCGGDQKPRPIEQGADSFGHRSVPQVQELGEELAAAVVDAARGSEEGRTEITGAIATAFDAVRIRTEDATPEGIAENLAAPEGYRRDWAERWGAAIEQGGPTHSETSLEIQVIGFGSDLVLVGMGAETTIEHGLRLKRDLADRFDQVVPLGYSNTMIGYLPVARQFDEWGYEVIDANQYFGYSGRFLRETEDLVHARIGDLVTRTQSAT